MVIVQSLWVGPELSLMEQYSIRSFLKHGFEFHLYTYEKVRNVPRGTILKNANEIMPNKEVFKLKETFLPFSDIWRYKMLYEKGNYWVDLDMICLKPFDFKDPYVFSSERTLQKGAFASKATYIVNVGILKAPKGSNFYLELYEKCLAHQHKKTNGDKIKYMRILRDLVKKYDYDRYVKRPYYFCNLDWWHSKESYMPLKNYKDKYGVKAPTLNSMFTRPYTVHFWRDISTKKYGIDFNKKYDPASLWELMKANVDAR